FEIIGEEVTGRDDYAIKKVFDNLDEKLICITEEKQSDIAKDICKIPCNSIADITQTRENEAIDDEFDYPCGVITTKLR
ncbi:13713_t:CDS:2, partial [Acaulospora colombiana]